MSAVPKPRKLTEAEYLRIERAAPTKSEFYAGEMFAMSGARYPHNRAKENLVIELGSRFRGGACQTLSSDMRVKVTASGLYCYPDVVVVCGEPEFEDEEGDTLLNPRVVIEVLSKSTDRYDRTTKFDHYQRVPAVQEYVLVSQDEPLVERYVRQADGAWGRVAFAGLDAELAFASVPAAVPLRDVYAGVTFPPPPADPAGS